MRLRRVLSTTLYRLAIVTTLGFLATPASSSGQHVLLKGKALFSFSTEDLFIQTEKYIYRVTKASLPESTSAELEMAALDGQKIAVKVPLNGIRFSWVSPTSHESRQRNEHQKKSRQEQRVTGKDGVLHVQGVRLLSFSDDSFLIGVNQNIYQISKREVPVDSLTLIDKTEIGEQVDLLFPQNAIINAWSYELPERQDSRGLPQLSAKPAIAQEQRGQRLVIRGTLLSSFENNAVLVETERSIYSLERSKLDVRTPKALDVIGASIEVSLPIEAIHYTWTKGDS